MANENGIIAELGALEALCAGHVVGAARSARLAKAIRLGAPLKVLEKLRDAGRANDAETILRGPWYISARAISPDERKDRNPLTLSTDNLD